jgi:hypothetical protein
MKRFNLLLLSILLSLSVKAQEVSINEVVTVKLPNSEKLVKGKFREASTSNNKAVTRLMEIGDFYKVDNVIIKLNSAFGETPKDHLQRIKGEKDEVYRKLHTKNYSSVIKTVNGIEVLVIQYDQRSLTYYNCFVDNSTHTSSLTIALEYPKSDEKKTNNLLDNLLNSIKFK